MRFAEAEYSCFNFEQATEQADVLLTFLTQRKTALGDVIMSTDILSIDLHWSDGRVRDAGALLLLRGDLSDIKPVGGGRTMFVFPAPQASTW